MIFLGEQRGAKSEWNFYLTMKYPGRSMNQDNAKRLGVVRLEALDHKFDGGVVLDGEVNQGSSSETQTSSYHVCHGKARHVENNCLIADSASQDFFEKKKNEKKKNDAHSSVNIRMHE